MNREDAGKIKNDLVRELAEWVRGEEFTLAVHDFCAKYCGLFKDVKIGGEYSHQQNKAFEEFCVVVDGLLTEFADKQGVEQQAYLESCQQGRKECKLADSFLQTFLSCMEFEPFARMMKNVAHLVDLEHADVEESRWPAHMWMNYCWATMFP
mmetsp:Transcript_61751/g.165389  ORF Transcript_61751/g.165389 Transcript_61751/m.165389 type:complete len:152 (+) Transcript_61751:56-511(+)